MIPDCYEFYLWTIGELLLPSLEESELTENQERTIKK